MSSSTCSDYTEQLNPACDLNQGSETGNKSQISAAQNTSLEAKDDIKDEAVVSNAAKILLATETQTTQKYYDKSGKLIEQDYLTNGSATEKDFYAYASSGTLSSITKKDSTGNVTKEVDKYDSTGKIANEVDKYSSGVLSTATKYDTTGKITTEVDKYDSTGKVKTEADKYDTTGKIIKEVDKYSSGILNTATKYDSTGKIIMEIDRYDTAGKIIKEVDNYYSRVLSTVTKYDATGKITTEVDKYDSTGKVKTEADKYDATGKIIKEVDKYSSGVLHTATKYDTTGKITTEVDKYNSAGTVAIEIDNYTKGAISKATLYNNDGSPSGKITYSTDVNNVTTISHYNAAGSITEKDYLWNGNLEKDFLSSGVLTEKDYLTNNVLTQKDYFTKGIITGSSLYSNGVLSQNVAYKYNSDISIEKTYTNPSGAILKKEYVTGNATDETDFYTNGVITEKDLSPAGYLKEKDYLTNGAVTKKAYYNNFKINNETDYLTNGVVTEKDYLSDGAVTEKDYLKNGAVSEKDYLYKNAVYEKDYLTNNVVTRKDSYSSGVITQSLLYDTKGNYTGKTAYLYNISTLTLLEEYQYNAAGVIKEHDYVNKGAIYEKDLLDSKMVATEKDYVSGGNTYEKDLVNANGVVTKKSYYDSKGSLITNTGISATDPSGTKVIQYGQPISWHSYLDYKQGDDSKKYVYDCGVAACENVLIETGALAKRGSTTVVNGVDQEESTVVNYAATHSLCDTSNSNPYYDGGTTGGSQAQILAGFGISAKAQYTTISGIADALKAGKAVIAEVSAEKLWGSGSTTYADHAITITGVDVNASDSSKIDGFYICDSGRGLASDSDRFISAGLMDSIFNFNYNNTTAGLAVFTDASDLLLTSGTSTSSVKQQLASIAASAYSQSATKAA